MADDELFRLLGDDEADQSGPLPHEAVSDDETSNNDDYLQDFLLETKEHLENIEQQIFAVKDGDNEVVNTVFRDFHTIKGLAGFVGQSLVQKIAHQTETVLDQCRKGKREVTDGVIRIILSASNYIGSICDDFSLANQPTFIKEIDAFFALIEKIDDAEPVAIK